MNFPDIIFNILNLDKPSRLLRFDTLITAKFNVNYTMLEATYRNGRGYILKAAIFMIISIGFVFGVYGTENKYLFPLSIIAFLT